MSKKKYLLLDSGFGKKLEKVGEYTIIRPCSLAVWKPSLLKKEWEKADLIFSREDKNHWTVCRSNIKTSWIVEIKNILFKISPTEFGHLGIFPEHSSLFEIIQKKIKRKKMVPNILNLFAYTGGATIAAAKAQAKVCHLDASKPSVLWAKENAFLNNLKNAPIRWIVDDAKSFLKREKKRNIRYDGIILDPPTFGRGKSSQVFKIEKDILTTLELCKDLLSDSPLFLILSCHTPGFTTIVLKNLIAQIMKKGKITSKEMFLGADNNNNIPSGCYVMWEPK